MEQYNVTGMSCAACQTRVEKAVSKVPGVTSCAVSLLTNSMGVEGTASPAEIIAAVENAGYGASKKGEKGSTSQSASTAEYEEMLKDKETPGHETPSVELRSSFDSAHVFLHGPYDVGMAAAEIL